MNGNKDGIKMSVQRCKPNLAPSDETCDECKITAHKNITVENKNISLKSSERLRLTILWSIFCSSDMCMVL